MKWESIKKRVAGGVYSAIIEGRNWDTMAAILIDLTMGPRPLEMKSAHYSDSFPVYAQKAHDVVMSWDIRAVARLRDLFPGEFPPSLLRGNLEAFLNDETGEWMVERIPTERRAEG